MKSSTFITANNLKKVGYLPFLGLLLAGLCFGGLVYAKTAKEIDASVDVALERFHKQVPVPKSLRRTPKGFWSCRASKRRPLLSVANTARGR